MDTYCAVADRRANETDQDHGNAAGLWRKVLSLTSAAATVLDLLAGVYSVVIYWIIKDDLPRGAEICAISTFSLACGSVLTSICIMMVTFPHRLRVARRYAHESVVGLKTVEILTGSIPRLWIALHVLSAGPAIVMHRRIYLYASGALSFVSACVGIAMTDDLTLIGVENRNKSIFMRVMMCCVKAAVLLSRMLVFAFMTTQIGWWTALLIGLHWFLFATLFVVADRHNNAADSSGILNIVLSNCAGAALFVFSWPSVAGELTGASDLCMALIFLLENIVGFEIAKANMAMESHLLPHVDTVIRVINLVPTVLVTVYIIGAVIISKISRRSLPNDVVIAEHEVDT